MVTALGFLIVVGLAMIILPVLAWLGWISPCPFWPEQSQRAAHKAGRPAGGAPGFAIEPCTVLNHPHKNLFFAAAARAVSRHGHDRVSYANLCDIGTCVNSATVAPATMIGEDRGRDLVGLYDQELRMNYRLLALAIAGLSFAQIATADAQSVYVAPGGVYIGGGPVYVLPGNGNGNGGYVEPTLGGVVGATPYLAPTAVYGNGGGYYNGNGGGYYNGNGNGYYNGNGNGYYNGTDGDACSAPTAGRGSTAASCRRGRRHWCPTATAAEPASSAAASDVPTTAIDACAQHGDASRRRVQRSARASGDQVTGRLRSAMAFVLSRRKSSTSSGLPSPTSRERRPLSTSARSWRSFSTCDNSRLPICSWSAAGRLDRSCIACSSVLTMPTVSPASGAVAYVRIRDTQPQPSVRRPQRRHGAKRRGALRSGAARGIRTPDPRFTKAVLYRLSYCGAAPVISAASGIGKARGDAQFVFHSRASRCASSICSRVICRAMRSRFLIAVSRLRLSEAAKRAAARLNHICARTVS